MKPYAVTSSVLSNTNKERHLRLGVPEKKLTLTLIKLKMFVHAGNLRGLFWNIILVSSITSCSEIIHIPFPHVL